MRGRRKLIFDEKQRRCTELERDEQGDKTGEIERKRLRGARSAH